MRTLPAAIFLLLATLAPCAAELVVEDVSVDRAEKLGMEFRFKPGSKDTVWVEFDFKTEGELKTFRERNKRNRVELKIYDEKNQFIAMARLREERSEDGKKVTVYFSTTFRNIEKLKLMLVSYGGLGGEAWEIKVGKFFNEENAKEEPAPKRK